MLILRSQGRSNADQSVFFDEPYFSIPWDQMKFAFQKVTEPFFWKTWIEEAFDAITGE